MHDVLVSVAALPQRIPASLEARVVVVTPLVLVAPASECEVSRLVERRPGFVPRLVVDKSPLRSDVEVLDLEPRVGEFRVGVCTERRALKAPVVRAFWDSIDARAA